MPISSPDPDRTGAWEAVVEIFLGLGSIDERPSRYGDKPALFIERREIAHHDGDGLVDLRLTAAGWRQARDAVTVDPAVLREPGRKDWVELRLNGPDDAHRLRALFEIAHACNV